jgi:hypothetical protein
MSFCLLVCLALVEISPAPFGLEKQEVLRAAAKRRLSSTLAIF